MGKVVALQIYNNVMNNAMRVCHTCLRYFAKGNTILKPQYAYIGEYFNGYAWFSVDGDLYGFLDEDGHIAIEPVFFSPWDSEPMFVGNYLYVLTEDYTDVIIDRQGNIVYLFSETDD